MMKTTERIRLEKLKKQIRDIGVLVVLQSAVDVLEETNSQDISHVCLLADIKHALKGYEARVLIQGE